MARAAVRTLRPRSDHSDRGAHDHPVTAKITNSDYDILTALSLIDQTGPADQIRGALDHYFTLRMRDRDDLAKGIARARARQEATLAALTGAKVDLSSEEEAHPAVPRNVPLDKPVTLRVDGRMFSLLTAFSLVDQVSLADILRTAINSYVIYRQDDPQLVSKLDAAKAKYESTMSVLSTTGSD